MRSIVRIVIIAAICISLVVVAEAAPVIYVKTDGNNSRNGLTWATAKKTIQAGIKAASTGGQVWVKKGFYYEIITLRSGINVYGGFAGTETLVTQADPVANPTIINARSRGSIVKAIGFATPTVIDGFTLTRGRTSYGGGIYVKDSTLTVNECIISKSTAFYRGGGVYAINSTLTITDTLLTENDAAYKGGGLYLTDCDLALTGNEISKNIAQVGSGLACENGSTGTIQFNLVTENDSGTTGAGGGMFFGSNAAPDVLDNEVVENTAKNGAGIEIYMADPVFASNLVEANVATGYGGGYWITGDSEPQIICDTVVKNQAASGGGFAVQSLAAPIVVNTIVSLNLATNGGAVYYDTEDEPAFSYCDFYHNGTPPLYPNPFFPVAYNPVGSDNNIDTDPLFVDATLGDYHLDTGSPCIDAGDSSVIEVGWVDLDNNPRTDGADVDMGCYESQP